MKTATRDLLAASVLAATAALALASCTSNPPAAGGASGGTCFLANMVNNFNVNADGTVDILVGTNKYYRLTTDGMCPDIDWNASVGIKTRSGSNYVCGGYDAEFIIPNATLSKTCTITAVAALTKEEYDAARAAKK